jgi:hypothetical protein
MNKTKIGIGVTTTPNRKEYVDKWLNYFQKTKPENYHLHIHEDTHYKGVAYSKNQNLWTLRDCDYIFLFDDDCYPANFGWIEFFINSKYNHLLYLQPQHTLKYEVNDLQIFENCGGVFMYLTKEVLNKVGYLNNEYGQYGYEHEGYSNRIFKSGLTTSPYQQLKGTNLYLHSIDYSGVTHKSSVPDYKKAKLVEENRKIFLKEMLSNKIYYDFE